ncbi:hypothetical protein EGH24_12080 [Halonotius terrestris]|uniref:Uncharacterized protein n=1 Tax=Halonotius terrestris TaxID=2487750 RepID=A0A8J8P656_9EURY|nr:hypothetical protein EGH24_12080 [Halonotius terrestris]
MIKHVGIQGMTLVAELAAGADIDRINLIEPNGEFVGQRQVAGGTQRVSFELRPAYTPGKYRLVGLKNEEEVADVSYGIQPDLRIVDVGIGKYHPDRMWNGSSRDTDDEAFVAVKNRGTGPDIISKLLFIGDVPYPSDEDGTNYENNDRVSGIYDPSSDSEQAEVVIAAGDQVTLYSSRSPFAFVPGAGVSCLAQPQSGQFELILENQVQETKISRTYDIEYSASSEFDSCDIDIGEV